MNLLAFISEFLGRRGLPRPDGRPLYAFRCSDEEFESLAQALATVEGPIELAQSSRAAAAFCLFVSEWWRRNYDGGPWAWDPILDAAGQALLSWPGRHHAVERGLGFWRRTLLRTGAQRGFLATLACEGGLPLKMLRHEGASLQRYFRAVLKAFHEYRRSGVSPTRLAEMEGRYLPRSFRQDVVFTLAGEICDAVWELQTRIGDVDNPVSHLDHADPQWRERIPLRLEDDTARALLNNLVQEASRLSRVQRADFKIVRSLVSGAAGWHLEAELRLPPKLGAPQMRELFGVTVLDLPGRFEILSARDDGDRALQAMVTQVGSGDERRYFIEVPPGIDRTRGGAGAAAGWGLLAASGTTSIGPIEPPGASALSELPWSFVDKEGLGECLEFLGEGSLRTRHETILLAVPATTAVAPQGESEIRPAGVCTEFDRTLYRVHGEVVCSDDEYGCCVVRTADQRETAAEFKLSGEKVHLGGPPSSVFRGAPAVWEYRANAAPRRVPAAAIEWHSVQVGTWRPYSEDCLGEGVIRIVDAGALRARIHAAIVPPRFSIDLQPADARGGMVELDGIQDCLVGIERLAGITGNVETLDHGARARITVHAKEVAPSDLGIRLRWDDERQIAISVPFPARGARFIGRDGRPQRSGETVAAARLAGVTATATLAGGAGHFAVHGDLRASDLTPELNRILWLRERLQPAGPGRWELDLRALRSRVGELFKATSDRYAFLRLVIDPPLGHGHVHLNVAPFDLAFKPDEAMDLVRLDPQYQASPSVDLNHFHVEAVPLWDHTATRENLPFCGTDADPHVWRFDAESRPPGPWLILGLEGGWSRARPMLWNVDGPPIQAVDAETTTSQVADIVRIMDQSERNAAFDALIQELSENAGDPRWADVLGYLKAFGDLPATTLDLANCMVRQPEAVITALLNAGEDAFDLMFHLIEQTPFSWHLTPVASWTRVSMRFAQVLREQLEGLPGAEDIVWRAFQPLFEKAPAHGRCFEVIVDWLAFTTFPVRNPRCPHLQVGLTTEGRAHVERSLMDEYRQLLQTHADDQWPEGQEITDRLDGADQLPVGLGDLLFREAEGTRFRVGVANAPILAAIASICELPVSPRVAQEIRSLRDFDDQWFEQAYAMALLIGIGRAFEDAPGMLA